MKPFLNLTICVSIASSAIAAEAKRPNVVMILADDLGSQDLGFLGGNGIETPNLDRLASEGMVFTNGYAAGANCEPSRACLLTGNYTPRHNVYAVNSTNRGPKNEQRLVPIPNSNGLLSEQVTVAETLKAAGYRTGIFGKWQLDKDVGVQPDKQGFDVVFQSAQSWGKEQKNAQKSTEDTGENPKGIYSITKAACHFMEDNKDRPFFIYLADYAIHVGLQARQASLEKFKAKARTLTGPHSDPLYLACIYDMDDGVGILMKKLKELGLEDNTLVVFTSDNGGTRECVQPPLRGDKGSYYEGGIREPFIVRWPGVTKPGSHCDVPVINQDFFPTFIAAANVPVPPNKILDGESLVPLLKGGDALKRKSIYWYFPGYLDNPVERGREVDVKGGFRTRPVNVMRSGDWKLHLFLEEWVLDGGREKLATNHAVELYNLKDDPGEFHDLSASNTAKRDELLYEMLAWQKSVNARIPTEPNPSYAPGTPATGKKKGKGQKSVDEE